MGYNNDLKITFPDLVMDQIKIIQKICSSELRDGDKVLKNAMGEQLIEGDDTRYSFLQSVEVLGSMLSPYFGNAMKVKDSDKNEFEQFCEYYDVELKELLDDGNEEFKKKLDTMFNTTPDKVKEDTTLQSQVNIFLLNDKIKEGRKMFRKLISVFKNNNFLGEEAYGDSSAANDNASLDAVEDSEEDILV